MINSIPFLQQQLTDELTQNILPFWMKKMVDEKRGGFFGRMTGENQLMPDAPKGGILNARILWTFSSAALHLQSAEYLAMATRAKEYIFAHFFDEEEGGTYWMLHADGTPADTKKQIYNLAFFTYALVEYYRASGDKSCLNKAIELFLLIEKHSFDHQKNGYFEAYSKNWVLLDDLRLSDKDANEKKTMNTHLHVLEAYTNLYRVWKDPLLAQQLQNLIEIFLEKIINRQTHHLDLFFDEDWNCKSALYSYGHDIEASWLLDEAALVLDRPATLAKVRAVTLKIADAAAEGINAKGAIMNEKDCAIDHLDTRCDWWPQAEAMVGFFNAYELTDDLDYLHKVMNCWEFTQQNIIDRQQGEWIWSVAADGTKNVTDDKAGFWKCPYHNGRMCLEIIERIRKMS